MTEPVTGDAEIRPGEKFCEDALSETCEALRVELGAKKNTINELTERITKLEAENLTLRLNMANRSIPWVAAMATDIFCHSDQGQVTHKQMVCAAAAIYAETEKQLGGAK